MSASLVQYLEILGIDVIHADEGLLLQAFTHKSFSADAPDAQIPHNERLEFLGDSILGARVAEELYVMYPKEAESTLTLAKIFLVKESTLADVARSIDLGPHIRLGNGEGRSGGQKKNAVLSDTLEALIAYVYLAHGRQSVASFIKKYIMSQLSDLSELPGKSRKSMLQEYIQKQHKQIPIYEDEIFEMEESGNVLRYRSSVYVKEKQIASGISSSKKKAQEIAAENAMRQFTTE